MAQKLIADFKKKWRKSDW